MKRTRCNRICRRLAGMLFLGALALAFEPHVGAQTSPPARRAPMPRRPSIIVIQCDGLGRGDLSCYGQTKFQTPNLDQLAANGICFTNYSAGGMTRSQSRAAFLLGRDADAPLTADAVTVAQVLRRSGYHTGLIGEWDLGGEATSGAPWKQGFDEFAGYLEAGDAENYYADYMWRYAPKSILDTNNQLADFQGREMLYANTGGKKGQYIPDLFTTAAINFAKNNRPDQFNRYRPFFLLLDYATPRANRAEAGRAGNGMQVPTDAPFSDEPWPQPEKNRAAMISRLDGDIGRLLDGLKKQTMESNTVIFFTSVIVPQKAGGVDPKFFQGLVSSNDLRVPMIAHWPGRIAAGQVSAYAWTARDFLPTAAEIALMKPPPGIDGASVLPALLGGMQTNRADKN